MIDVNKNYWLTIAPCVYGCIKQQQVLLYNTANGEYLETQQEDIVTLIQWLYEKKNLGAVCCPGEMLIQSAYSEFVSELVEKGMGCVTDVASLPEKPIQMMPILNLQCDVDRWQKLGEQKVGEDVLRYLFELNIYLNDTCDRHCIHCNKYARQSLCCQAKQNEPSQLLSVSVLQRVLSQIQQGVVGKLNLLGGDVLQYPHYAELPGLLSGFKGKVHIWNHYANFADVGRLGTDFIYNVVVPFPLEEELLQCALSSMEDLQVNVHFYITQMEEYERIESLIEQYGITEYAIHAVYTGNNLDFFEENVYMDREDLLETHHSFHHIFANQKMNSRFFGSLSILANGDVYANVNSAVLGNVANDTLIDIIDREMTLNTAWRRIRDASPCSDCLYQYLCPPPSNYEALIGKYNLCKS